MTEMSTKEIADQLSHYLYLYSVNQKEEHLAGILTYAGMLAGRVTK